MLKAFSDIDDWCIHLPLLWSNMNNVYVSFRLSFRTEDSYYAHHIFDLDLLTTLSK